MRHWFKLLALLAVFVLAAGPLAGCGLSGDNSPQQPQPARIKIGIALYKQDDTFISIVLSEFQAAARALEARTNTTIIVNAVDAKGSQALQNDQVDRFLAQNYDVICVNMVDRTAAAVIIDKAKVADIPVVFFNREPVGEDMQRWNRLYYVGADARQSGSIQGKIVANCYLDDPEKVDRNGDGKLQYVMLEGEPGHQDALIRTEYSIKTVTGMGIKVEKLANDTANWQRGQATTKMAQWIDAYGDQIEVVFSNNDDMALGAIDAYKAAGIQDMPIIVGVDGTPPALEVLREGYLAGTAGQDATGQAQSMLELCHALFIGQDISTAASLTNEKYLYYPYHTITPKDIGADVTPTEVDLGDLGRIKFDLPQQFATALEVYIPGPPAEDPYLGQVQLVFKDAPEAAPALELVVVDKAAWEATGGDPSFTEILAQREYLLLCLPLGENSLETDAPHYRLMEKRGELLDCIKETAVWEQAA